MIRSTAAKLLSSRGRRRARDQARGIAVDDLPFEMFDAARTAAEAASAAKLERIYHKGQDLAWNGKEVLPALIARHGGIHLDPATRAALQGLFAVILWGELAAWKISSDLAVRLEPLEAKLAATAQAHDEARHFYVMHDYLTALGPVPRGLGPHTTRVLSDTLRANTLAKKLVGMQLMIEPMALALFHLIRAAKVEPVLCDLLALYERDEARHVALGVLHLPKLLTGMSTAEAIDLWGWEFSAYWNQLATLRELEPQFRVLGIDVREVVRIGRQKQVRANQQLIAELGSPVPVIDLFVRFFDAKAAWDWPTGPVSSWRDRASDAWRAATRGLVDEVGVPPAVTSG